jgi:hypothetical protein
MLWQPYFNALDLWDKIDWQLIGYAEGKDALLNGTVDATAIVGSGTVTPRPGDIAVIDPYIPDTPGMELLGSGRKVYLFGLEEEVIRAAYQGEGVMTPIAGLVPKGAMKGLDGDMIVTWDMLDYCCMESLPDDVVIEMIRIRKQYVKEFGEHHAIMELYSENPYPFGLKKEHIHPAVFKAAEILDFEVPQE